MALAAALARAAALRLGVRALPAAAAGAPALSRWLLSGLSTSSAADEPSPPPSQPRPQEPPASKSAESPLAEPDHWWCKDMEAKILRDIEPATLFVKDILHSDRYSNGAFLSVKDEELVVKLLDFHPSSEDKIGCGLQAIKVDRHPQFRNSRCLFVLRTDGTSIDFSYLKCLQGYIRAQYPSHAEKFIQKHFKSRKGSSTTKSAALHTETDDEQEMSEAGCTVAENPN